MRYRFVLRGTVPEAALKPVEPVSVELQEARTKVEFEVRDDAHLQGVIELIHRLGAHVEGFQQLDSPVDHSPRRLE
jgi:hypothetical protein